MRRNLGINTLHNSIVKPFHVFCGEGRVERDQLVEDAAQGPNVTFEVVWLVLPDLRTGIVGSTRLSLQDAHFGDLRHIQISQLDHTIFSQKHISTLNISMNNLFIVKSLQTQNHLVEDGPNVFFLCETRGLFGVVYFGLEIAVVAVLHDDT